MKAALTPRYGPPETVRIGDHPTPSPASADVLVRVAAAAVTTADWRMRASAFPGGLWLPGRLMTGLFRPRNPVLGSAFAGTVTALGPDAKGFAAGDRVFGFAPHGAHAEYLAIKSDAAIAPLPDRLSFEDAAALPFGAASALVFLRDIAGLASGEHILIVGASGATGSYAVQIAKALGAEVTAVASAGNEDLVRSLGADHFVDYRAADPLAVTAGYDVIFDTVGATTFRRAGAALRPTGRYVPLNFSMLDAGRAALSNLGKGPTMKIAVSGDTRAILDDLIAMIENGQLRPVIDTVLDFEQIAEAHRLVETRHRSGTLVVTMPEASSTGEMDRPRDA
ncbi:MAG: NAD(P)-dependent alcohol dehydrogenase [Silicimonas sp.]|nr:NAD(P)-dependent alcohol dehydrogenase [Silicimonas sp.]